MGSNYIVIKIFNASHPSLILGNGNMNTVTTVYANSVNQHDGDPTTTTAYNTVDTQLELEPVPGQTDTYWIKRDWSTSSSGIDRPQFIAVVGDTVVAMTQTSCFIRMLMVHKTIFSG